MMQKHLEKWHYGLTLNIHLSREPAIPSLDLFQQKHTQIHQKTHKWMLITAVFEITKSWKPPAWIDEETVEHSYRGIWYSNKNEQLHPTWKNPTSATWNEWNQPSKSTYCGISLIWSSKSVYDLGSQRVVLCGEGRVAGGWHEDGMLVKFCFFTLSAGYTGIFGLYTWDMCISVCVCYASVKSFPFLQSHVLKKQKVRLQKSNYNGIKFKSKVPSKPCTVWLAPGPSSISCSSSLLAKPSRWLPAAAHTHDTSSHLRPLHRLLSVQHLPPAHSLIYSEFFPTPSLQRGLSDHSSKIDRHTSSLWLPAFSFFLRLLLYYFLAPAVMWPP